MVVSIGVKYLRSFHPEKLVLIVFLVVFSILGIIGYSIRAEPKKIVLPSQAGSVIFDHVLHLEYSEDCSNCHHTMTEETAKVKPCGKCHNPQKKGSELMRSDAFHQNCGECHSEVEESENCNMCHKPTGRKKN